VAGVAGDDPAIEKELVQWLLDCQVDALLIGPTGDDHRYLQPAIARGLPVVVMERDIVVHAGPRVAQRLLTQDPTDKDAALSPADNDVRRV